MLTRQDNFQITLTLSCSTMMHLHYYISIVLECRAASVGIPGLGEVGPRGHQHLRHTLLRTNHGLHILNIYWCKKWLCGGGAPPRSGGSGAVDST